MDPSGKQRERDRVPSVRCHVFFGRDPEFAILLERAGQEGPSTFKLTTKMVQTQKVNKVQELVKRAAQRSPSPFGSRLRLRFAAPLLGGGAEQIAGIRQLAGPGLRRIDADWPKISERITSRSSREDLEEGYPLFFGGLF